MSGRVVSEGAYAELWHVTAFSDAGDSVLTAEPDVSITLSSLFPHHEVSKFGNLSHGPGGFLNSTGTSGNELINDQLMNELMINHHLTDFMLFLFLTPHNVSNASGFFFYIYVYMNQCNKRKSISVNP